MCARKSEQYVLWEDGRACGVKVCSPALVTASGQVIIKAAFEILRLGIVKGQFVSLFRIQCHPHARDGITHGV